MQIINPSFFLTRLHGKKIFFEFDFHDRMTRDFFFFFLFTERETPELILINIKKKKKKLWKEVTILMVGKNPHYSKFNQSPAVDFHENQ